MGLDVLALVGVVGSLFTGPGTRVFLVPFGRVVHVCRWGWVRVVVVDVSCGGRRCRVFGGCWSFEVGMAVAEGFTG